MNKMEQTEEFGQWLGRLQKRDSHAWERIDARLFFRDGNEQGDAIGRAYRRGGVPTGPLGADRAR